MNVRVGITAAALLAIVAAAPVAAHAPMVVEPGNESPATAFVLEDPDALAGDRRDPGRGRRGGLVPDGPAAGDALVVEVTAPDAAGGIATSFAVLGPGLPRPRTIRRPRW